MRTCCIVAIALAGGISWAPNVRAGDAPTNQTLTVDEAARFEGLYKQDNLPVDIRVENRGGYLTVMLPGRGPLRMLPAGENEFHPENRKGFRVVFDVTGDRATGFTIFDPDGQHTATRTGDLPKAGNLVCTPDTLTAGNGTKIAAERCRLFVPENRTREDSKLIELSFVRLISTANKPRAPLVYLHGGPGGQAVVQANSGRALTQWAPYLDICDVILLDQRGCGTSAPKLYYPLDTPPTKLFFNREAAIQGISERVSRAADHFRERGVDLSGYTSVESADDLNDLRKALGAEKISLTGFSYGTHLAQATIRRHGATLENVVMCGVEGLDMTFKYPLNMDTQFRKLSLMVAKDPNVGRYVPDLYALTKRVLDKLDKDPIIVEVYDRKARRSVKVPIGRFGLQLILRFDVGDASDLVVFPRLMYTIDKGDPSVLQWFVNKRIAMFRGVKLLTWVMDGASGAPPYRWARINAEAKDSIFGNVMNFPYPYVNDLIGNIDVGDDYRRPLISDVRTLFLSGTLDWNTPPYQAERVRWGFSNSSHIIVDNAGHEQVLIQPEIQRAVLRFLKGEDVSDVTVNLPPLSFVPVEGADGNVTHPSVSR